MSRRSVSQHADDDYMDEQVTPLKTIDLNASPLSSSAPPSLACPSERPSSIPVGHWRDSIWDLCRYGPCHGSIVQSCCCPVLAVGQVMTRLQIPLCGGGSCCHARTTAEFAAVFRTLVYAVALYWISRLVLLVWISILDPNIEAASRQEWVEPGWAYHILAFADSILAYVYWAMTLVLVFQVRQQVRQQYAIPAVYCDGVAATTCEDVTCACCCPCLAAAQLLRHTTDYDVHPSRCCTSTGLPLRSPGMV